MSAASVMALQNSNNPTRSSSMDQYYSAKVTELREVGAESCIITFKKRRFVISHRAFYKIGSFHSIVVDGTSPSGGFAAPQGASQ
jgi:hypothetical protein